MERMDSREENGLIPYGQKGVDGGSKWRAGTGHIDIGKMALPSRRMPVKGAQQCERYEEV